MVLKRTRAYYNAKRIIISTPMHQHDAVHQHFILGDQRHWHVPCPRCGHSQILTWEKIRWDENEVTRPDGLWDFDRLAGELFVSSAITVALLLIAIDRRHFSRNGVWVPHNPLAPKTLSQLPLERAYSNLGALA
jgi:hypothetical protein